MSLHRLQQQCSEAKTGDATAQHSMTTGALWFPLQSSEANGLAPHFSLQVECTFTSDPNVLRIREEIQRRRWRKTHNTKKRGDAKNDKDDDASECDEDIDENTTTTLTDPTFAFTQPFLSIEWSLIASTSIRHLFFHSDIERLANFREFILYGDIERELDKDEGLQIDDDHLAAFKACQFSAQYLDHCVETLSQRLEGYSDDYCVLDDTRSRLMRTNRSLKAQRKRLQKEHDELDLLISTYQRVLEKNGDTNVAQIHPSGSPEPLDSPAVSPTPSLSPKKPVFLKTWEERERERRLEKEVSKAQRIEEEKQRLLQRVMERQQRDDYEALISKFTENRKHRAARRIQTFFRSIKGVLRAKRYATETRAATLVQAAWKRFVHLKQYPRRLERRREEIEMLLMAQSEKELRQWLAGLEQQQCEEATSRAMSPPESIQSNDPENAIEDDIPSPSASPSKQVVDALVTTWRKLHRVFVIAHRTRGTDYHDLFSEIDLRKDDVLDRAELRLGARSFGVRLDRKITRALITLIHRKCGAPSKPLLVTFEQFIQGFELIPTETESIDTKPPHDTSLVNTSDFESKPFVAASGMTADDSPETHKDQDTGEEALIMSIRAFREAIYESAMTFMAALGRPSSDYRAFRDALAQIFAEFDADRNGELDVGELVACMSCFNLRLSDDNVSLLRELFVGDREHGTVGVAEFISFVLAHSASSSAEDELGLLGHRLREAIMILVSQAQTQTESIEDAVRLVFGDAYKRKGQQLCSIRDFVRVFNRLRLGVTPTQVARLVVRLDRDGDRSISFEELLVWLRVRSKASLNAGSGADPVYSSASQTALQLATKKAKALRLLMGKLASGGDTSLMTLDTKTANLTVLFYQIDTNNSGKINQEELQMFLENQDLTPVVGEEVLIELSALSTSSQPLAALVAKEMMALLDMNANGVVTLPEWLTFAQYEGECDGDDPVVIEALRKALKESENNDPEQVVRWFNALPGAIQAAMNRPGEPIQIKIRVAEFKTALRAKLGGARSVSLHVVDRVAENLDKDRSGWITTGEFCVWAFPPRDLEEILRLVTKSWQMDRFRASSRTIFAANLYTRFDADGNGSLAVRELLSGFAVFGVILTEYEARVLLIAFDVDGDGCWSRSEFLAFVDKLFPVEEEPIPQAAISSDEQGKIETAPSTVQIPAHHDSSNDSDDIAYSDDDNDFLLQSGSSNALSSPAYSDEEQVSVRPVEYSEDFDED
ncbi:EF-hand domain pair [Phytophthora cinnamomi]|uniref:EF-hand domain pair n=1 Tax=Phytophthora cinnamomi TaxID=4785 RepID=UPI003559A846|nr:EF-hand domain pair [Phytophthora cinnamomi]